MKDYINKWPEHKLKYFVFTTMSTKMQSNLCSCSNAEKQGILTADAVSESSLLR